MYNEREIIKTQYKTARQNLIYNNVARTILPFSNNIERQYNNEDLNKMFRAAGLKKYKFDHIFSMIREDCNRISLTVIVKHKRKNKFKTIALDIKVGDSSWQQLMDITFGYGADADYKIVVFDDYSLPSEQNDPTISQCVAYNFSTIVNNYNDNTRLLMSSHLRNTDTNTSLDFTIFDGFDDCIWLEHNFLGDDYSSLPEKEEFEKVEFWIFYFDKMFTSMAQDQALNYPCSWFDYQYWREDKVRFGPIWNEEGLFIKIYGEVYPFKCQWLWKNKKNQLEQFNGGSDISLSGKDNLISDIFIQVSNIPFSSVTNSGVEDKNKFASLVIKTIFEFEEYIDKIISAEDQKQ